MTHDGMSFWRCRMMSTMGRRWGTMGKTAQEMPLMFLGLQYVLFFLFLLFFYYLYIYLNQITTTRDDTSRDGTTTMTTTTHDVTLRDVGRQRQCADRRRQQGTMKKAAQEMLKTFHRIQYVFFCNLFFFFFYLQFLSTNSDCYDNAMAPLCCITKLS